MKSPVFLSIFSYVSKLKRKIIFRKMLPALTQWFFFFFLLSVAVMRHHNTACKSHKKKQGYITYHSCTSHTYLRKSAQDNPVWRYPILHFLVYQSFNWNGNPLCLNMTKEKAWKGSKSFFQHTVLWRSLNSSLVFICIRAQPIDIKPVEREQIHVRLIRHATATLSIEKCSLTARLTKKACSSSCSK